jgi:hypothetical protein
VYINGDYDHFITLLSEHNIIFSESELELELESPSKICFKIVFGLIPDIGS